MRARFRHAEFPRRALVVHRYLDSTEHYYREAARPTGHAPTMTVSACPSSISPRGRIGNSASGQSQHFAAPRRRHFHDFNIDAAELSAVGLSPKRPDPAEEGRYRRGYAYVG